MSVNNIYNSIAKNISISIDKEWEYARLNIEASNDWAKIYGTYQIISGESKEIDVSRFEESLNFEIMELHELTTEGGHNRWNRAIFKLSPDGKFDVEFIWDQDLNDEIERLS